MEAEAKPSGPLRTITALVTVGSVIASGLWSVHVYNENQIQERERRKLDDALNRDERERELSKPFRELQLQMCNDIITTAADLEVHVCVEGFPSGRDALRIGRRGSEKMILLKSKVLMFGDEALARYVRGFEELIDSYAVTVSRDMDLQRHLDCFPCADVWLAAIGTRCSHLVTTWWLKRDQQQTSSAESDPQEDNACVAYARLISP